MSTQISRMPPKRACISNKRFAYDEMVMATDGTRYYIKYLDEPTTAATPTVQITQPQQSQIAQIPRTTIYRNIQPRTNGTGTGTAPLPVKPIVQVSKQTVIIPNTTQKKLVTVSSATAQKQQQQQQNQVQVNQQLNALKMVKAVESDEDGQFACPICKKTFKHRHSLPFHMERYHKNGDGVKDCECPCGRMFLNKKYMRRHQKKVYDETGTLCGPELNAEEIENAVEEDEDPDDNTKAKKHQETIRTENFRTNGAYSVLQLIQAIYSLKTHTAHANLAARNFNVPRTTLSRYHSYVPTEKHMNIFSEKEELKLRDQVIQNLREGVFFDTDAVLMMAQKIINQGLFTANMRGRKRTALDRPYAYYFITKYLEDFIKVTGPGEIKRKTPPQPNMPL